MTFVSKLVELQNVLESVNGSVVKYFNEGLANSKIDQFFKQIPLKPTDDLVQLYQWRNGLQWEDIPTGKITFGVNGVFYPLEESITIYKDYLEYDFINYFPIFYDDAFLINLDRKSREIGKIFIYSPGLLIVEPVSYFDSLTTMVETFIKCFKEKAFFYDEEDFFAENYELSWQISQELNPNSDYWKTKSIG